MVLGDTLHRSDISLLSELSIVTKENLPYGLEAQRAGFGVRLASVQLEALQFSGCVMLSKCLGFSGLQFLHV